MKRPLLIWWVLWSYGTSLTAAPMRPDIGIFRLGEAKGEESRRALGILEARFHRWLENQGSGVSVQRLGNLDPQLVARERATTALRAELSATEAAGAARWARLAQLRKGREGASDPAARGLVAAAFAWESVGAYLSGDFVRARSSFDLALSLSPDGQLGEARWEREAPEGWLAMAEKARAAIRRDCVVLPPAESSIVAVNGFSTGRRQEVVVPSGRPFWIQWVGDRGGQHAQEVRCLKAGQIALASAEASASLSGVGDRYRVGRLAFIEPRESAFRLYLFTEGVGLDEIPLEKKLSVQDVLSQPLAAELPVDRAGFGKIQRAHGWSEPVRIAGPWSPPDTRQETAEERSPARWYNNWTTWAVAGGIVAGILVAVLANRPGQVQTQAHGGLKFPID